MNLTHGGMDESEALHWCTETFQRFGDIVYNLSLNKPETIKLAYKEYYEMKRYFMREEWDDMMTKLDRLRIKTGHPTILELINERKSVMFPENSERIFKPVPAVFPSLEDVQIFKEKISGEVHESVEQLSLF